MDASNSQDKGDISITLTEEQKKTIIDQATNCICYIKNEYSDGAGFFCLIPNSDFARLQPVLISSYMNLKDKKILRLFYKNQEKMIDLESRHVYSNATFVITIIELKDDEFPPEIFLMLDDLINNTGKEDILNAQYINQDIYLIYSNKGNNPEYSYDKIKEIKDFLIKDYCPGEYIHSGFPILNLNSFGVIGIHIGKSGKTDSNLGMIIRIPIMEYNKSKKGLTKQNTELLNIVKETDEPKSILELISQKYLKDKDDLVNKLNDFLIISEFTDDYKDEVTSKFKKNLTKAFDTKTDTNTLLNLLSKVKGLPNLVVYINIGDKTDKGDVKQLYFVNGKIDLVDNTFTFENSDIFGYGNYESNSNEEGEFIYFRPQNTQLYLKIKIDCIYIICYREGVEVKFILKIKQNFMDNPLVGLSGNDINLDGVQGAADDANEENEEDDEDDFVKIMKNKENIDEIFEKQTKFKDLYLNELVIYKTDD